MVIKSEHVTQTGEFYDNYRSDIDITVNFEGDYYVISYGFRLGFFATFFLLCNHVILLLFILFCSQNKIKEKKRKMRDTRGTD